MPIDEQCVMRYWVLMRSVGEPLGLLGSRMSGSFKFILPTSISNPCLCWRSAVRSNGLIPIIVLHSAAVGLDLGCRNQEVEFVQGLRMLGFQSAATDASDFAEGFSERSKDTLQLVPRFFDRKDQSSGSWTGEGMGNARLSLNATPNSMNVYMDTGNPQLNCTLDSVLKISGVGAAHAATQEAYSLLKKEVPTTKCDLERIVKKAGREGLQWGMAAGAFAGIEYGMEKARGKQDWKNAAVGGVVTGVMLSVSDGIISQDKMVRSALTAGALATAADLLKFF